MCFLVCAAAFAGTFAVHYFGNQKTKDFIESNALVVIDFARESSWAPDELIFLLDGVASFLPFSYGSAVDPGISLDSTEYSLAGVAAPAENFRILKNTGYLIGYDEVRGVPAWCAYRIFKPESFDVGGRPPFEIDTRTRARIAPGDYTNSGYDRGHMAPNQAIGACYGNAGQLETFKMSNIVPQLHDVNAGVWKELEQRALKRYTRSCGEVWILCGPIFDPAESHKKFGHGRTKVCVPDAFYFVIADREETSTGAIRAMAFIVPHKPGLNSDLKKYLVSIDEIESKTGCDFFSSLPLPAQAALESTSAKAIW